MARKSRKQQRDAAPNVRCGGDVRAFKVALYVRLSVEDIRKKESDSIGTQTSLLMEFMQTQPDMELYKIYEDVNYTGTNFERPAFKKMMEDIQANLVNCVIVKDVSRFGRNFYETGRYLEIDFPRLGVRFISVGDNYDSLSDENGIAIPFKNLMNEIYARDISKKVQSGKRNKQKRGEFCGSFAPYGYIRDGSSLVIDEDAAVVVRQIFKGILDGLSDTAIAQKLNGMEVLPPGRHRFEKGITKMTRYREKQFWYKSAIKRISENPVYTGNMVSGKYRSDFLWGGGTITTDKSEWIITEDTHPAIISQDDFARVQRLRETRKQTCKATENHSTQVNIFKGLIFCGDCKTYMIRSKLHRADGNDEYCFLCSVYEQADKHACTKKNVLESEVNAALYLVVRRQLEFVAEVNRMINEIQRLPTYNKQRDIIEQRINELQKNLVQNRFLFHSLQDDYKDGILTEQDYFIFKTNYNKEKDDLQQEVEALIDEKQRQDALLSPKSKWLSMLQRFESERQLSAPMVSALVERIEVYDGKRMEFWLRYRDEFDATLKYINETRGNACE